MRVFMSAVFRNASYRMSSSIFLDHPSENGVAPELYDLDLLSCMESNETAKNDVGNVVHDTPQNHHHQKTGFEFW